MSKLPEEQKRVFSFLQAQLDKSKEDHNTMQLMLDQITGFKNDVLDIKNDVLAIENKVNEKYEVMTVMVAEVRDDIKLRDNESFTLQQSVFKKSVELANNNHEETDQNFKKTIGGYRRLIWSKLKIHFEVSKYTHIRRIDFQDALVFVSSFKPEDYFL